MTRPLLAGIDAGGTTFKLGLADAAGNLIAKERVPTTGPEETIAAAADALLRLASQAGGRIGALGIASFGPVEVDPSSSAYGTILETPKQGWAATPLLLQLSEALGVPGALDTDVNGALEAEMARGAAKDLSRAAYITVGTGIGVGVKTAGRFAGRPSHPELGHVRVERQDGDSFEGCCPFHSACLEGLAAAPALTARFGPLEELGAEHPAWQLAGFYLAQLCYQLVLGFRLERIVIGGGVAQAEGLLPAVGAQLQELDGGYLLKTGEAERIVQRAALGDDAGLYGAFEIAKRLPATRP